MERRRAGLLASRTRLSIAIGIALLSFGSAATAQTGPDALELGATKVQGKQEKAYKIEESASAKYAVPLKDVPQTINVVPAAVIQDQKALGLREVLANVSGITFNAGEGGGGSGDSINVRGFSANANIQVDGLRDSAQTSRTDTFNLEQVEVIKGPNSVFGGAGTTGGSINLVSKQPNERAFTELTGSLGTDNYHRVTLDSNQPLTDVGVGSAFRINLMGHENDVAGRDHIDRERWGVAPSLALGLSEDTRLTLSYFHQTDDNLPDYGVPAFGGKRAAGVDRDAYFGFHNVDKEHIQTDAFTVRLDHDFNENLTLQNLTRYSRVDRDTVISAAHINVAGVPAGTYRPAGPQGYGRDTQTEMVINQTNLTSRFDTLGMGHTLVTGMEIAREDYDRTTYNYGLAFPTPLPLNDPPGYYTGLKAKADTAKTSTRLDTKAIYAMDTLALSDQWELTLGLRHDWIDGDYDNVTLATGARDRLGTYDKKLSGRAGLVFKPAENGRIYVAYGTSFNPSAEYLASTGGGVSAATENLDPEKNKTYELGTKWELLGGRLALDGAIFRVEKTNAREQVIGPNGAETALAGEQRVQGVELGATGHITDAWTVYSNFTFLDSETLKAGNTVAGLVREGQALANTPPRSLNVWTTYELPAGWRIGYGARYVSERNVSSSGTEKLDAYWLSNAMIGYRVNRELDLQLNVNNVFDKDYVERVRTQIGAQTRSSALEYGDGRTAILTASYTF